MLDINNIIQYKLPDNCFNIGEHPKNQIFIHHTAGGGNAYNVISGWKVKANKVATAFIIAGKPFTSTSNYKEGDILQCFSSDDWAYHLGLKYDVFTKAGVPYKSLDKTSVAIEICNWGQLTLGADGQYRNYVNGVIPQEDVVELDKEYRGFRYYHKYSESQLSAAKDLLVYLCDKYNITKTYNEDMWDISNNALSGTSGIWTHTSVRVDKNDCSPQPELIKILKSIA